MRDCTGTPEQIQALTVGCRWCRAPIGSVCVSRYARKPLTGFPAHTMRMVDADRAARGEVRPAPVARIDATLADLAERQRLAGPPAAMGADDELVEL